VPQQPLLERGGRLCGNPDESKYLGNPFRKEGEGEISRADRRAASSFSRLLLFRFTVTIVLRDSQNATRR